MAKKNEERYKIGTIFYLPWSKSNVVLADVSSDRALLIGVPDFARYSDTSIRMSYDKEMREMNCRKKDVEKVLPREFKELGALSFKRVLAVN